MKQFSTGSVLMNRKKIVAYFKLTTSRNKEDKMRKWEDEKMRR